MKMNFFQRPNMFFMPAKSFVMKMDFFQRPNRFFMSQKPLVMSKKRYCMDRYATNTSQYLFREQPRSYPKCWIGDLWQQQPSEQHNTCRLGASLRWGPEKNGLICLITFSESIKNV